MKKWSDDEILWLRNNYSILGTTECTTHLNRSWSSVVGMATKLNLKAKKPGAFSKNELSFLYENYPKYGVEYSSNKLNRTKGSINKQARILKIKTNVGVKENNIRKKRKLNNYSKYDVSNFININSKYVAYVLGYLWADGCISKNEKFLIIINLVKSDAEFLYDILKSINSGWKIGGEVKKFWKNSNGELKQAQNQRTIRIYSQELHDFLKENDYSEKSNKSFSKIWKILSDKQKNYFVLGLFDGDGHFNYQFRKNKYHSGEFVITSSYDYDWSTVEEYFNKNNIEYSIYRSIVKLGRISKIIIRKKDSLMKLYDNLYQDDFKGLNRKYIKFKKYYEYVN